MREFLVRVLTDSRYTTGCGMSTRPEYYSGRGATTSDLDSEILFKIYEAIRLNVGDEAAKNFALMVKSIKVLSATDFLLSLQKLDSNDFVFTDVVDNKGIYATDEVTAFFTVMSVVSGKNTDYTKSIRGPFLRRIGMSSPGDDDPYDPYDSYNDPDYLDWCWRNKYGGG